MPKNTEVLALARAGLEEDAEAVLSACRIIAANEPPNSTLGRQLQALIERRMRQAKVMKPLLLPNLEGLISQMTSSLSLDDIELPDTVRSELALYMQDALAAQSFKDHNLPLGNRVLLQGPPGNGKTALAGALAGALGLPIYMVDLSNVITSYLGETSSKLAKILRGVAGSPCILFFDEMETLLAARAGIKGTDDVGEMRRVVASLLLEMDRLPEHVVLIGATNHPELLDKAVRRRFHHHWEMPAPGQEAVNRWHRRFAKRFPGIPVEAEMGVAVADGRSIAELETEAIQWCRGWVRTHRQEQKLAA